MNSIPQFLVLVSISALIWATDRFLMKGDDQ